MKSWTKLEHASDVSDQFEPYLYLFQIWVEKVPQSLPAWHWIAPQCCPEFYSYNLTSNGRPLHTERQWVINYSGKKQLLFLLKSFYRHLINKKAIVDSVYQSLGDVSKKMPFVKICILPLLCSLFADLSGRMENRPLLRDKHHVTNMHQRWQERRDREAKRSQYKCVWERERQASGISAANTDIDGKDLKLPRKKKTSAWQKFIPSLTSFHKNKSMRRKNVRETTKCVSRNLSRSKTSSLYCSIRTGSSQACEVTAWREQVFIPPVSTTPFREAINLKSTSARPLEQVSVCQKT